MTAVELARQIDVQINRVLQAKKIPASPQADDPEFLRRVYLDIAGTIPPLDRVEAFLNDTQSDKRVRVVDELLQSPEYARHMTNQWREHLIPSTAGCGTSPA